MVRQNLLLDLSFSPFNASILSRYGSIFYISAQVMVGTVRPAIAVFLPISRTRFADE